MFEKRVQKKKFGPKKDKVRGDLWKLHDLYTPDIIGVIKSRKIRGEVGGGGAWGTREILVGGPEGEQITSKT